MKKLSFLFRRVSPSFLGTEKVLFTTLLFLAPLQTRKLLYAWRGVEFNEYLSAFLYVTDILVGAIIFLWMIRTARRALSLPFKPDPMLLLLGGFWLAGLLSLADARNVPIGIFHLLKLGEGMLLFGYIRANLKEYDLRKVATVFVASAMFQSLWALVQFYHQSDLGLKILGESPLHPDFPYVANFFVEGDKIIRAYAGFPHPNVLAAFLFTALFLSILLAFSTKRKWAKEVLVGVFGVLLVGFLLTFSRAAIGLFVLFFSVLVGISLAVGSLRRAYGERAVWSFATVGVLLGVMIILLWPYAVSRFHVSSEEEAVVNRLAYTEEASQQISQDFFFGVGIGNFIPAFKESFGGAPEQFYQPVHNIFLLVASETGLTGLSLLVLFLATLFYRAAKCFVATQNPEKKLFVISCGLLVVGYLLLGFFDHFFWTLQQGRLLFWSVAGIVAGLIEKDPILLRMGRLGHSTIRDLQR